MFSFPEQEKWIPDKLHKTGCIYRQEILFIEISAKIINRLLTSENSCLP